MPSKRTQSPLAERLRALAAEGVEIAPAELAELIRRPGEVELVEAWIRGDSEPDGESRVLLRVLDDPHVARLAVERLRNRVVRNLEGEGAQHAGVSVPYGTSDIGKLDAGSPQ